MRRLLILIALLAAPEAAADVPRYGVPVQVAEHMMAPTVRICPTAPVTQADVKEALRPWQKQCHNVAGVVRSTCALRVPGSIYITGMDGVDFKPTTLGFTMTSELPTIGFLAHAVITLRTDKQEIRPAVLIHEFGHAFGYYDNARTPDVDEGHGPPGHAMAAVLEQRGDDWTGLSRCDD